VLERFFIAVAVAVAVALSACAGARAETQATTPEPHTSADPAPAGFWSFQPIRSPRPPEVRQTAWPRTPIDRFILSALEAKDLPPSGPATPRDLLRRVTFDLTGLPPTLEDVEAFERHPTPEAFGAIVDRLLASPHYGERWGRWWLDVARYADTNGQDENKVMANAWRYRDWVVRAFNRNLPFDQFVTHQLAGDLLPAPPTESAHLEQISATGFLVLGPKMLAEQDKPKLVMDIVDEQIDTVGRAFLGLTLGCARCHDHKFDPVPARDYYALAGIFKSTRTMENLGFVSKFNERRVSTAEHIAAYEAHQKRLGDITNRIGTLTREANATLLAAQKVEKPALPKEPRALYPEATQAALAALERERDACLSDAPEPIELALAVADEKPVDLPVHLRGSHLKLAPDPVPRGFVDVIAQANPPPPIPSDRSGRLEFAQWLVAPSNPLTARVLVNRVWQAHFGEGLVRTPDNFGLRGDLPSHPDLLDWLATQFVQSGWDLKALHRLILRSAVYQQSSQRGTPQLSAQPLPGLPTAATDTPAAALVDPDNRLLSFFPRRRLEAEMIRDALLLTSGRLDPTLGGTLVNWKNDEYTPGDDVSATAVRRTLYLPVVRDRVYDALTLFDFANPSVTTAKRVPTVVAQQALFFLNSPLVRDAAAALADSIQARGELGPPQRIREAYRRILTREPSSAEHTRAQAFLAHLPPAPSGVSPENTGESQALAALCQTLFASNEFVYRP
jgi:hypothetical protein